MKEYIYLIISIAALILTLFALPVVHAGDSTAVTAKSLQLRTYRCKGAITKNFDQKQYEVSCGLKASHYCSTFWEGNQGRFVRYRWHQCTGGDAWSSCTDHCYMVCASPYIDTAANCTWENP